MNSTPTPAEEITLLPAASDAGENAKPAEIVVWSEYREKLEKLKATAETLTVTSVDDKAGMKLSRETRLSLREIRIAIEKRRKELKDEALRKGQKIDAAANELKALCEPLEARLLEQEQFAEREAARIVQENRARRIEEIGQFTNISGQIDYGVLPEEEYQTLLQDAKDLHALRAEQARKAKEEEAARLAAEAAERERVRLEQEAERQRIAAENARLKKEAEEREKAAAVERARVEKERQAERAAAAEAQRVADEKARVERARIQAEADRAAAEAKKLADAEASRLKKEAEEKKKADLATKKAAAAPDTAKLRKLEDDIYNESLPHIANERARTRLSNARDAYAEEVGAIAKDLESGAL